MIIQKKAIYHIITCCANILRIHLQTPCISGPTSFFRWVINQTLADRPLPGRSSSPLTTSDPHFSSRDLWPHNGRCLLSSKSLTSLSAANPPNESNTKWVCVWLRTENVNTVVTLVMKGLNGPYNSLSTLYFHYAHTGPWVMLTDNQSEHLLQHHGKKNPLKWKGAIIWACNSTGTVTNPHALKTLVTQDNPVTSSVFRISRQISSATRDHSLGQALSCPELPNISTANPPDTCSSYSLLFILFIFCLCWRLKPAMMSGSNTINIISLN